MTALPFFPLAIDAYKLDCGHLSDAEHGRYLLILMELWVAPRQRLPNDDEWLARRFRRSVDAVEKELRPLIDEFCQCDGHWITQKRLTREYERAQKATRQRSEAAKSRWKKPDDDDDASAQEARSRKTPPREGKIRKPLEQNESSDANGYAPTLTPTPTPTQESEPPLVPPVNGGEREPTTDELLRPALEIFNAVGCGRGWKTARELNDFRRKELLDIGRNHPRGTLRLVCLAAARETSNDGQHRPQQKRFGLDDLLRDFDRYLRAAKTIDPDATVH